jgi:peptidoglycan/LPS O-acetylase OafA/YrhL
MDYRREIDGLRAIAVIPVILFHAGLPFFSGGFVGVDIFFVISGYLITSVLFRDIKSGGFSFSYFYERRVRRIAPALLLVMFVSVLLSWFVLLPADMKAFSQSLVSITLVSPNLFFWLQTDYFSPAAEMNPLLHTWSLGVEEQFYIFWPLIILFIWRFELKRQAVFLIALCSVSFFAMEYARTENASFAFYQFPTRAWELILGALAAVFLSIRDERNFGPHISNTMSLLGLVLIFISVVWLDKKSGYPGVWTLLPTSGTFLLLVFCQRQHIVTKLLGHKWLVAIGLVSYSAYLWHQPIFAFSKHYLVAPASWQLITCLVFVSFVLAFFTWRFVETPFRSASKVGHRHLYTALFAALLFFMGFGLLGHFSNGFDGRNVDGVSLRDIGARLQPNYGLSRECDSDILHLEACVYGAQPDTALWGDSYAMQLAPALTGESNSLSLVQYTLSSCRPLLGLSIMGGEYSVDWSQRCIKFNQSAYDRIVANDQIKRVVVSSMFLFSGYSLYDGSELRDYDSKVVETAVVESLRRLKSSGKEVIIVSPMPSNGRDIGRCLARAKIAGEDLNSCNFKRSEWSSEFLEGRAVVSRLAAEGFKVLWLDEIFCGAEVCQTAFEGTFLYRDKGHISISGATYMREKLDFVDRLLSH